MSMFNDTSGVTRSHSAMDLATWTQFEAATHHRHEQVQSPTREYRPGSPSICKIFKQIMEPTQQAQTTTTKSAINFYPKASGTIQGPTDVVTAADY